MPKRKRELKSTPRTSQPPKKKRCIELDNWKSCSNEEKIAKFKLLSVQNMKPVLEEHKNETCDTKGEIVSFVEGLLKNNKGKSVKILEQDIVVPVEFTNFKTYSDLLKKAIKTTPTSTETAKTTSLASICIGYKNLATVLQEDAFRFIGMICGGTETTGNKINSPFAIGKFSCCSIDNGKPTVFVDYQFSAVVLGSVVEKFYGSFNNFFSSYPDIVEFDFGDSFTIQSPPVKCVNVHLQGTWETSSVIPLTPKSIAKYNDLFVENNLPKEFFDQVSVEIGGNEKINKIMEELEGDNQPDSAECVTVGINKRKPKMTMKIDLHVFELIVSKREAKVRWSQILKDLQGGAHVLLDDIVSKEDFPTLVEKVKAVFRKRKEEMLEGKVYCKKPFTHLVGGSMEEYEKLKKKHEEEEEENERSFNKLVERLQKLEENEEIFDTADDVNYESILKRIDEQRITRHKESALKNTGFAKFQDMYFSSMEKVVNCISKNNDVVENFSNKIVEISQMERLSSFACTTKALTETGFKVNDFLATTVYGFQLLQLKKALLNSIVIRIW